MKNIFENCLFLGAHCDDIVIPCSGMIQKLLREGNKVSCLCLSYGDEPDHEKERKEMGVFYKHTLRGKEFKEGMKILGVKHNTCYDNTDTKFDLSRVIRDILYWYRGESTIFTHSPVCVHQDHRVVSEACRIVARKGDVNLIYYEDARYELSHLPWKPNMFYELSHTEMDKKECAIRAHRSQYEKNKEEMDKIIHRGNIERFEIAYLKLDKS